MFARYQQPPEPDPDSHDSGPGQSPSSLPPSLPPAPQRRRIAVQMPVAEPRLTYILLAVNVLIFAYMMFVLRINTPEYDQFLWDWAKINDRIRDGEYYRLFTAIFLHADLMHIGFNGYALYLLGRNVEALFGTVRFSLIYVLGGLTGSLASFIFTDGLSIGASGAVFALVGAQVVYFYHHRDLHGEVGRRYLNQLFLLVVINLALGFSSSRIDNAGHIGGLVGGVILAWFIGPAYVVKADVEAQTLVVKDENPIEKWALPSLLYVVGLGIAMIYAITGTA